MSGHRSEASNSSSSSACIRDEPDLHPRFLYCTQLLSEVSSTEGSSSTKACIGSGSEVFRVTHVTSGSQFVVKRTSKRSLLHLQQGGGIKKQLQRIDTERRILERLSQAHTCKNNAAGTLTRFTPKLHAAFESSSAFYHVLEDCNSPLRNLEYLLQRQGRLSEEMSRSLICRLCQAVQWLHRCGVIHRDLKPSNLVFDDAHQLRVIDFGLSALENLEGNGNQEAKVTAAGDDSGSTCNDSVALFSVASAMRLSAVGSVSYLSPELILGVGHDYRVDLWSVGVIIFQILCGYQPFQGDSESEIMDAIIECSISWPEPCLSLMKQVQRLHEQEEWKKQLEQLQTEHIDAISRDPACASPLSPAAISLILRLLQLEPAHRIGQRGQEESLLQHLFFSTLEAEQSHVEKLWAEMAQEQAKSNEEGPSRSDEDDRIGRSVELMHEASVSSSSPIHASNPSVCPGFQQLLDSIAVTSTIPETSP